MARREETGTELGGTSLERGSREGGGQLAERLPRQDQIVTDITAVTLDQH